MKLSKCCRSMLLASLCAAFAGPAFAESPTATATAGLFTTETDDIQSVTDFSDVEFDKWLTGTNFFDDTLDLGGAYKVGDLVISPWYKGSLLSGGRSRTKTSTAQDVMDSSDEYIASVVVKETDEANGLLKLESDISLLIGIPDLLGIKLGYTNEGTRLYKGTYFKDPDYRYDSEDSEVTTVTLSDGSLVSKSGTIYDPDGDWGKGVHKPYIEAGTNLAIGDFILKPSAALGIGFINEFCHTSQTQVLYPAGTNRVEKKSYDIDKKSTELNPALALTLKLPETENGFRQSVSAGWEGLFRLCDDWDLREDYAATETNSLGEKTVTTAKIGTIRKDQSDNTNMFALIYTVEKDIAEGLTLAAAADLAYSWESRKYYDEVGGTSVQTTYDSLSYASQSDKITSISAESSDYEYSASTLIPTVSGAVSYNLTPKLRFLAGASITLPSYTKRHVTITHPTATKKHSVETDTDGRISEYYETYPRQGDNENSDKSDVNWSHIEGSVHVGLTWFLSENFNINTALELGIGDGGNSVFDNSLLIGAILKY